MSARFHSRGVTLVELVVSIAVIAIAGAALSGTLAYLNGTGNSSILKAQAQSIAHAYLGRITTKSYTDPNGVDGEATQAQYDDVDDYQGLDELATDGQGNSIGNFRVRVNVGAGVLNGIPAADVRRVDVTVDYGNGLTVIATGYRTRYP